MVHDVNMIRLRHWVIALLLGLPLLAPGADTGQSTVFVLTVHGAIGPATSDFVTRGLVRAADAGAEAVVLRMDTPGGLDTAMRDIIQAILNSPVPVIGYVAPSGARAASAGTYILYASHIAAMAPATNLGAATPVQIGTPASPAPASQPERSDRPAADKPAAKNEKEAEKPPPVPAGDTMQHKMVNDAVAYIRGLAQLRGRNAEWAERAVREAASLPADEALKMKVVDLVARDLGALLKAVDGRAVRMGDGERTLHTADARIEEIEPDWRSELLSVITNPNVAYILMLMGIYGLFFEFYNPGFVAPGVIGAICLLVALFAFQVLPINYAGLALLVLGIAFMVVEAFVPSFGALGIGGVVAFVIGSILLFDTGAQGYEVSRTLIGAVALTSFAFFATVVGLALKARRRPVVSGSEGLIGWTGEALEDFDGDGRVSIRGEAWDAATDAPVKRGEPVRVVAREGLKLRVTPHKEETP